MLRIYPANSDFHPVHHSADKVEDESSFTFSKRMASEKEILITLDYY